MRYRHETPARLLVALSLAFAIIPCALANAPFPLLPVSWGTCEPSLVDRQWQLALGNRLECGTMRAILDEDHPASGTFTVGLVRIKAGRPTQRKGSLFFNFGGPGANPLDTLPATAYLWMTSDLADPLDGDKRRLADRFDLVAVIPRGLRGGTRAVCRAVPGIGPPADPTLYLADWNWAPTVKDAQAQADACGANPLLAHVGTLQHVRDMEQARIALGEPELNFVGVSYGSWIGAFYAAMYPNHAGRMVLDSVMNYAGTFEDQLDDYPYERQSLFARNALRPALARPGQFGLGSDPRAIMSRFRAMPIRAAEKWAAVIDAPTHLVAALTLADWIHAQGDITSAQLTSRSERHVFSPDRTVNDYIRRAAGDLATRLDRPDDPTVGGMVDLSIYYAVVCADTPWTKQPKDLRALANRISARYPAVNGNTVITGLVCANWPTRPRWRPPVTELAKAPPMLLIQAEYDPATPLTGAMKAFNATPGSYLVVVRDMDTHGLFGHSATPCIEQGVGRFLLTGALPDTHLSYCDFVPRRSHGPSYDASMVPPRA